VLGTGGRDSIQQPRAVATSHSTIIGECHSDDVTWRCRVCAPEAVDHVELGAALEAGK
jgi:hypothetical protein